MTSQFKGAAKWILPSGIVDWIRARARPSPELWRGVYRHFRDVPREGGAFEGDEWVTTRARATAALKAQLEAEGPGAQLIQARYLLLPACASILAKRQEAIKILDFGGAFGIGYLYLQTAALVEAYEYYIVENQRSCQEGEKIFTDARVRFCSSLDEVPGADIVLMSGVLQYIEDYEAVVRDISRRFRPRLFLFTLLPVGDFPTFAAMQVNLRGSCMPVWFFNHGEVARLLRDLGYRLVFQNQAESEFEMASFPATHRLRHMSNMIFQRDE